MTTNYNSILIISLFMLLASFKSISQNIKITGRIIEQESKQPLAYANILIKDKSSKTNIKGAMPLDDGHFTIETTSNNFYLEISYLGFITKTINDYKLKNNTIDLGIISLSEDTEQLDQIMVQAEISSSQFKLDKRVFNVGKDISSTGASALDVLNNVPSVNVNIEGAISLRGSEGVQILINGKPSILTEDGGALGSITANMIDSIEVITNPSAKYDAEGTSGIINIVIKKDERKGLNGSLSLNTGVPDNNSFGLSLNRRSEKFNLFTQLGLGRRAYPRDTENLNTNLIDNTSVFSLGTQYRNEKFYNITLGTDYYINANNVITLSGNFAYEIEDQPSHTNFKSFDTDNNINTAWDRIEETEATNPKWQYELQYKRDFDDHEDHDLLLSATGNSFGKDLSSLFNDTTVFGQDVDNSQNTRTNFVRNTYIFKLDYTKPFSKKWHLETGGQYTINDVSNDYEVQNLVNRIFETDLGLTNNFKFNQNVFGTYVTGAYQNEKWGIKAGFRLEQTHVETELVNSNTTNTQDYTNLFPSVHTSYKVSDLVALQIGFSSRIYRPSLRDLNPFNNIRNNFNIRQGNPELMPEYTDSYEITSIFDIGKTALNFGLYHRYTTDVIERISLFEDNITTQKPENIGTNSIAGAEFNTKYNLTTWLNFNVDLNYNTFNRVGTFESTIFDFKGNQWTSKLMARFKFPAQIDFEATGNHQSKVKTVQGTRSASSYLDLGLRKKILKGKGIVSFSVRDVFASRIFETYTTQDSFKTYSKSTRGRFVALGFSYGFGKGEAMEYSGGRRH